MDYIYATHNHLLQKNFQQGWLATQELSNMADAVHAKGSPFKSVGGLLMAQFAQYVVLKTIRELFIMDKNVFMQLSSSL